jgi:hypothetical protein
MNHIRTTTEERILSTKVRSSHNEEQITHILAAAEIVGSIEADVSFLKDENLIEPNIPDPDGDPTLQRLFWEPEYEVALIVEGRSIRFEARWPITENLYLGQNQRVLAMKVVGIAAAFKPGTA